MAKRTIEYGDRMSDTDALMWHIERDPALRSTITSVWVLDRMPDESRIAAVTERASRAIPRLRQRAVIDPLGIANPTWEIDASFDLRFHLRRLGAPGAGTLRDLFDLAEPIAMQSFDRDRPLWEFYLIEGLEGGRAGAILKLHHAISDGVGLVRMTEKLVERSRDAELPPADEFPPLPETHLRGDRERTVDALRHTLQARAAERRQVGRAIGRGVESLVRDPVESVRSANNMMSSLGRMLKPISEPMSPVMQGRSLAVSLHGFGVPLDAIKRAGKAAGGSVNDAFVAAVTGGFRLYHEHHGKPVDELRMAMPINLREGEKGREAGNQFVPARFLVPVAETNPVERMRIIRERVLEQRAEPALPTFPAVSGAFNRLPAALYTPFFGSMLKAVDFTTSNVPGPRFPVYMSGAKIEQQFPFGPTQGAANITAFSYDGQFQVGLNADPAAIQDADVLAECLEKGFGEVLSVT